MNANETPLHTSTRDQMTKNYMLPFGLQQWAKPITVLSAMHAPKWQCKTIQKRKPTPLVMYQKRTKNKYSNCGGVKYVSEISTLPYPGTVVKQYNDITNNKNFIGRIKIQILKISVDCTMYIPTK